MHCNKCIIEKQKKVKQDKTLHYQKISEINERANGKYYWHKYGTSMSSHMLLDNYKEMTLQSSATLQWIEYKHHY